MGQEFKIKLYNRYTNNHEIEKVYGEKMVNFAYDSVLGKLFSPIVGSRILSKVYGNLQDRSASSAKVAPFIKKFNIEMDQYQPGTIACENIENSYKSFNEFFIRKFKEGKREFINVENKMGAFAEARYVGYSEVSQDLQFPVKGTMLNIKDLINKKDISSEFIGGPLMIARLCPVDYHRYHYPLAGKTIDSYQIRGDFHSVNPLALKHRPNIFIKNERRVSILETEKFGKLAYIEVGATCVGKIVQTHNEKEAHRLGDEKGYFLFGGSTVILCGEKGKWSPSSDIINNTKLGIETYIHLGDEVAKLD